MSDRLKKLERTEQYGLNEYTLAEVLLALNAAIDRINELEARYEGHTHKHSDHYGSNFHHTPPIPGGDDGK